MATKRRRKISGKMLAYGPCDGDKSKDGKHTIWIGMTGDMLPYFCVNGCRKWASEQPPTITNEDLENM